MNKKKITWIISGVGLAAIFLGPIIYYFVTNSPK